MTENEKPKPNLSGVFKLTKNEGFDAYLKAAGVAWPLRKIILASGVTFYVEHDEKANTLEKKVTTLRGTSEARWQLDGTEVKDKNGAWDDVMISSVWVQYEAPEYPNEKIWAVQSRVVGGKTVPVELQTRYFSPDEQTLICVHENVEKKVTMRLLMTRQK